MQSVFYFKTRAQTSAGALLKTGDFCRVIDLHWLSDLPPAPSCAFALEPEVQVETKSSQSGFLTSIRHAHHERQTASGVKTGSGNTQHCSNAAGEGVYSKQILTDFLKRFRFFGAIRLGAGPD